MNRDQHEAEIDGPKPTSTGGLTTKVVKGSFWTLAGQVAPLVVSFVTARLVIGMLGDKGYGVLVWVSLIPTYFLFADFGMGIASTKFASQAFADGDPEKEARIVRTTAFVALLSSLPFAVAMFAFSPWVARYFEVREEFLADASLGLKLAAITFVVNFMNTIFNTPQLTRLRMDLNTFVTSGFRMLGMIATPVVLYLGFGIPAAAEVLLGASLLTLAGHLFISGRLLPQLFAFTLEREQMRTLLKFGGAFVGAGIAGTVLVNAEKGILTKTVSTDALGYYSIAFTVAAIVPMFSVAMIQSLIPAFSQLQGKEDLGRLNALFSRGLRLNMIVTVPALVVLAIVAKTFFSIWLKDENFVRESPRPLYLLLCGIAFSVLAHFPYASILAAGRTDIFAKLYWIQLVLYVPLVWLLTTKFGIAGAAAAWSIRGIADTFCLFVIAKNIAGVSFRVQRIGRFCMTILVMALPLVFYFYRGELDVPVAIATIAALGLYALLVWRWVLEREETAWLAERLLLRSLSR